MRNPARSTRSAGLWGYPSLVSASFTSGSSLSFAAISQIRWGKLPRRTAPAVHIVDNNSRESAGQTSGDSVMAMIELESRLARLLTNGRTEVLRDVLRTDEGQAGPAAPDDPADHLTWRTSWYIALVTFAAAILVTFYAPKISSEGWQGFVTLIFLAILFERVGLKIYGDTHISAGG